MISPTPVDHQTTDFDPFFLADDAFRSHRAGDIVVGSVLAGFEHALGGALDHPDAEEIKRLAARWAVALVAGALLLVAFLVNRFAPEKRARIRRVVILFGLYALAWAVTEGARWMGAPAWAGRIEIASDVLEAFTIVNLVALAVFDIALPKAGFDVVSILSDLVVGLAYIVTTIGIFHAAGMNLSSVIATSAVVSGVLALSLQATLGNILGGIALQLDGSIHVGDWIALESGKQGKVREIHWRHTVVETRDWDTIIVPNASLLAGNITILGKRNGEPVPHRMWVYFNVDYRYSPAKVIEVVRDALTAAPIERVAANPPPNVICYDFAKDGRDSFGYYAVRYWLTDLAADDPTSSAVRTRVYAALKRAGIPLARPSSTVFYAPDDERAERRRAERHRARRHEALHAVALFKSLTEEELSFISDHLVYAPFAPGETITKQGAVAHWLYVLVSGKADIVAHTDAAHAKLVTSLVAPSFFGEMGMLTGEPRAADVVACTEVECFRLDKAGFEGIIHARPELVTELSTTLAKRRVELATVREGLNAEQQREREQSERARILPRIEAFFGLDDSERKSTSLR